LASDWDAGKKSQLQIPNPKKPSETNIQFGLLLGFFAVWNLFGIWCLDLGILIWHLSQEFSEMLDRSGALSKNKRYCLTCVVTCDYITRMKRKRSVKWPVSRETTASTVMRETVAMPQIGLTIPVRVAKAKLSALLELVAQGQQVTITSDGLPKAVISPVTAGQGRKQFTGMGEFLRRQPVHGGPSAEEVVREDRDARGW